MRRNRVTTTELTYVKRINKYLLFRPHISVEYNNISWIFSQRFRLVDLVIFEWWESVIFSKWHCISHIFDGALTCPNSPKENILFDTS